MLKPKSIDIADSNLALFGSQLEKDVKKAAAETEPAWANAGKELGIQIWRIEKFQVKSWPKDEYGSFYSGDSYILLNTYKEAGSPKVKFNVHFWLGNHTTQDEAGTAAYKTVELDTLLGDEPVQYREVQGCESELFQELFPKGIKIMEGGVDSGFRHVEPEQYQARLFHVKGKAKNVRALQVNMMTDSLNSGDSFVLDLGLDIIVFNGKSANVFEKNKAAATGRGMQEERAGKAKVHTFTEGDPGLSQFWEALGEDAGGVAIQSAADAGDDSKAAAFTQKLFRLSDESGSMEFKLEKEGKISVAALDEKDAFLLDTGDMVFVWIGKEASDNEKKQGLQIAMDYLKKNNKPATTNICKQRSGGENKNFLSKFHDGDRASSAKTFKSRKCPDCNKFLIQGACPNCGKKP